MDTRIISATNSDIERLIQENAFRSDLYYRLNTLNLTLPPLADRREDILTLAEHFLDRYAARYRAVPPRLTEDDKALLLAHTWSGNTRELENVMHRYVVLNKTGSSPLCLCLDTPPARPVRAGTMEGASLTVSRGTLAQIEHEVIMRCLEANRWNRQKAADELGICRATLWRKLKGGV